jgi:uncharacterized protein (TIGR03118 family)
MKRLSGVWPVAAMLVMAAGQAGATDFSVTNLVTNDQTANAAQIADPNLVNAWGISFAAGSPFWVSDNGSGLATLYNVNPLTNATATQGLVVTIPPAGAGTPTGQVFNTAAGSGAFNGDLFLFVSEDGTISGWRPALGTAAEALQPGALANVYKGTTMATMGGHSYLYAANFRAGTIDVVKGDAAAPSLPGSFIDQNLPVGYAPFDIQLINGKLYVTYALQDPAKHDDVAGLGNGLVDVFNTDGTMVSRLVSNGLLDSPWGLALAPSSFGELAGDLLVGNFGNGEINAYNPVTGAFGGTLTDANGAPLVIDGLWDLTTGNGVNAGSTQQIYFSAGPQGETNGLFGAIAAVPEPASAALLGFAAAALGWLRRRGAKRQHA